MRSSTRPAPSSCAVPTARRVVAGGRSERYDSQRLSQIVGPTSVDAPAGPAQQESGFPAMHGEEYAPSGAVLDPSLDPWAALPPGTSGGSGTLQFGTTNGGAA